MTAGGTASGDRLRRLDRLLRDGHDSLDSALEEADGLFHDGRIPRRTLEDLSDAITLVESALRRVPSDPSS